MAHIYLKSGLPLVLQVSGCFLFLLGSKVQFLFQMYALGQTVKSYEIGILLPFSRVLWFMLLYTLAHLHILHTCCISHTFQNQSGHGRKGSSPCV